MPKFCHFLPIILLSACVLQTDIRLRRMPDNSMEPTIFNQQVVRENFGLYRDKPVQRFDLVMVKDPDKPDQTSIKRVVGLPGETVRITGHRAFVNERPLAEPFIQVAPAKDPKAPKPSAGFGPFTVPAGEYFLLGDNRTTSLDSRLWSRRTVKRQDILAAVQVSK